MNGVCTDVLALGPICECHESWGGASCSEQITPIVQQVATKNWNGGEIAGKISLLKCLILHHYYCEPPLSLLHDLIHSYKYT